MFSNHYCRPARPHTSMLSTVIEGVLFSLVEEGCLYDAESLCERLSLTLKRDGMKPISKKAFLDTLKTLVDERFVVEVSGHRLDTLVGR